MRHKKRDLEIEEGKHRIKKKVWKQRIKHLLYENQNEITLLQTENEVALKKEHDTYTELNKELKLDKRALHIAKKEMELFHHDALKALMQGQDRAITKLRQEYEQKVSAQKRCWMHKVDTSTKMPSGEVVASACSCQLLRLNVVARCAVEV